MQSNFDMDLLKKNEDEGGVVCGPLDFDNSFNRNTGLNTVIRMIYTLEET